MASFNKVILIGHLTADPELRQAKDVSVTSFTIGVNRKYNAEETDFIRVAAWRKNAEFICRYFKKGMPILVEGYLQARSWTDEQGNTKYANDVVAEAVSFAAGKSDLPTPEASNEAAPATVPNPANFGGNGKTYVPQAYGGQQAQFENVDNTDDLPF